MRETSKDDDESEPSEEDGESVNRVEDTKDDAVEANDAEIVRVLLPHYHHLRRLRKAAITFRAKKDALGSLNQPAPEKKGKRGKKKDPMRVINEILTDIDVTFKNELQKFILIKQKFLQEFGDEVCSRILAATHQADLSAEQANRKDELLSKSRELKAVQARVEKLVAYRAKRQRRATVTIQDREGIDDLIELPPKELDTFERDAQSTVIFLETEIAQLRLPVNLQEETEISRYLTQAVTEAEAANLAESLNKKDIGELTLLEEEATEAAIKFRAMAIIVSRDNDPADKDLIDDLHLVADNQRRFAASIKKILAKKTAKDRAKVTLPTVDSSA